jgi:hypothetical protein
MTSTSSTPTILTTTTSGASIVSSLIDPLIIHALSYLHHHDFQGAACSCHRLSLLCRTPRLWRSLHFGWYSYRSHHYRDPFQYPTYRPRTMTEILTDKLVSSWITKSIAPAATATASVTAATATLTTTTSLLSPGSSLTSAVSSKRDGSDHDSIGLNGVTSVVVAAASGSRFAHLRELHIHNNPHNSDICYTLIALGSLPSLTTLYMGSEASAWTRPQFEALLAAAPNLLHLSVPWRLTCPTLYSSTRPRHLLTFHARYARTSFARAGDYKANLPSGSTYIRQLCISFPKLRAVSLLDFSKVFLMHPISQYIHLFIVCLYYMLFV